MDPVTDKLVNTFWQAYGPYAFGTGVFIIVVFVIVAAIRLVKPVLEILLAIASKHQESVADLKVVSAHLDKTTERCQSMEAAAMYRLTGKGDPPSMIPPKAT